MANPPTITLTGASGTKYKFNVYGKDLEFNAVVSCVYYVSKRSLNDKGVYSHTNIYIGQTEDFNKRHADHHKQACFEQHGYNAISVHEVDGKKKRESIEQDLIDALNTPCNG